MEVPHQTANIGVTSQSPKHRKKLPNLQLNAIHVIGTTTESPASFSCSPSTNTFAYCAGAFVVLAKISDGQISSKRYFRYRSHRNIDQQSKDAPPAPRYVQACSTSHTSQGSPYLNKRNDITSGSKQEKAQAVTCLSLSLDGKLLAIGEVLRPASLQTFHL